MIAIEVPGVPVAFARTRGANRYTPAEQRAYMFAFGVIAKRAMNGSPPMLEPVSVSVRAIYVAPASWSRKQRETARWKTSKPDLDNIIKLAKDSMTGIVYRDDAQVVEISGQKVYGLREQLVVTVMPA